MDVGDDVLSSGLGVFPPRVTASETAGELTNNPRQNSHDRSSSYSMQTLRRRSTPALSTRGLATYHEGASATALVAVALPNKAQERTRAAMR